MPRQRSSGGDPARTLELLWRASISPRPTRGPKQGRSVDDVVRAAVALADAERLDAVSMRRVAQRLGVAPMSVYTYVPGKAEPLLVGWRPDHGFGATAAGLALLLLLRFALLRPGIYLGLTARGTGAVTTLQVLEFPFGFLANTFGSPQTMPGWLGAVAEWNPLSSTVSAMRELFGNPGYGGESWVSTHAGLIAVVWPLLITAVFLPLSVARYRRLGR